LGEGFGGLSAGDFAGKEIAMDIIKDTLETILDKMGIEAAVDYQEGDSFSDEDDETTPSILQYCSDELGILIGRRGQTLSVFNFVVKGYRCQPYPWFISLD
jgi:predicted RNA-binding protein Jag